MQRQISPCQDCQIYHLPFWHEFSLPFRSCAPFFLFISNNARTIKENETSGSNVVPACHHTPFCPIDQRYVKLILYKTIYITVYYLLKHPACYQNPQRSSFFPSASPSERKNIEESGIRLLLFHQHHCGCSVMCKTTQITPSSSVDDKPLLPVVCPSGCPTIISTRTRLVKFHETVQVYDTFQLKDMSEEEKSKLWLSDDDWDEMRQDYFQAKRKKCPSVEQSQPYRMADRKATIRYAQLVVLREQQKFRKSLRRWNEMILSLGKDPAARTAASNPLPTSSSAQPFPCWNCFHERVGCLYRMAAKKSRTEAQGLARLCEIEVRSYHSQFTSEKESDDDDSVPDASCNHRPKFLTAITACY
jgi:hypothetical protein